MFGFFFTKKINMTYFFRNKKQDKSIYIFVLLKVFMLLFKSI